MVNPLELPTLRGGTAERKKTQLRLGGFVDMTGTGVNKEIDRLFMQVCPAYGVKHNWFCGEELNRQAIQSFFLLEWEL